jgi:hypothetical protein
LQAWGGGFAYPAPSATTMGIETRQSRRGRRTLAAALALAALCLGWGLAASSGAGARPLVTGLSDPEAAAMGQKVIFDRIRNSGAEIMRVTAYWHIIAPQTEPETWTPTDPYDPNYNWTSIDREVVLAHNAGLEPMVQVYNAPRWAQGCDSGPDSPCDPDPVAMGQFAKALATRYSGLEPGLPRVRYWEPQNEPNLSFFFNPQFRNGKPVSPEIYRALLNRFAANVKSVHADNIVVTAGFAPLERPGASIGPLEFVRRLLCMRGRAKPRPIPGCNAKATFDVLATNPYTTGGPTHKAAGADDVSLGDLPEMRRLLRAAEAAGRIKSDLDPVPFWVTEFGWDTRPPDPGGLPPKIHARWTAEAMYRAWLAGVSAFFWYQIRDDDREGRPHNETVQSGLYLRGRTPAGDRPKLALKAFRFPFVAFGSKRGVRVWGRTRDSEPARVAIEARNGGGWRRIGFAQADRDGVFHKLIRSRVGRSKNGSIRARVGSERSVPFSLRYVPDFYQPPFGRMGRSARIAAHTERRR